MIWTLSLAVKSTVVLTAATLVARALGRRSAAARHTLWSLTLLCLLALPVLSATLPRLELPLLSASSPGAVRWIGTVGSELEGMRAPLDPAAALPSTLGWRDGLLLAWLAGMGLALVQLASGSLFVGLAARRAQPVTGPDWSALLDEAATTLGVRRRVELRLSPAVDVPNVWGYRSPVVLLPRTAASWSGGRRRAILLHELAHVGRHDRLTQTLAYVVRALYWPHPLVWWAVASLRREAECACDDRVLRAGNEAPEYAGHLLETARGVGRPASRFLTAASGAEHTRLGDRVRALLDDQRDRSVPSRPAKTLLGGASLLALALLAAADPVVGGTSGGSPQAPDDAALEEWIVHEPFGCLIEKRFPEIDATIEPASEVAEARIYFRSSVQKDEPIWYWVKMTATGSRFVGRLPRPRVEGSPVQYRIEARRKDGRVASTERHVAVVVPDESRCGEGVRIAPAAQSSEAVTVHSSVSRP